MTLEELRESIDVLDKEILNLFAKRFSISMKVWELKKEIGKEVLDTKRFKSLLTKIKQEGKALGLSEAFIEDVWERIHKESMEIQKRV